ncbi:MAG: transglycosylase SLT domain-containing protein [Bdellovibrionales bacterium]|nr:transglycosylase SLT domain-containing protein [Bdellovibrionales bacterium]
MNQIYLIISILFLVPASFASLGSTSNPNGSYGGTNRLVSVAGTNAKVCDSSQWEKDFLDVINEEEKSGKGKQAIDSVLEATKKEKEFCEQPPRTAAGGKLFMLAMAKAFIVKESNCNPGVVYPHGPNGAVIGLGQMGVSDAKNHKCTKPDGSRVSSVSDLKDPKTNVRCIATIMVNCASGLGGKEKRHIGAIASGNRGQYGFAGCFWQPVRKGTGGDGKGGKVNNQRNREQIASATKKYCEKAAEGTSALVASNLMSQQSICQAKGNMSCSGSNQMAQPLYTPAGSTTSI